MKKNKIDIYPKIGRKEFTRGDFYSYYNYLKLLEDNPLFSENFSFETFSSQAQTCGLYLKTKKPTDIDRELILLRSFGLIDYKQKNYLKITAFGFQVLDIKEKQPKLITDRIFLLIKMYIFFNKNKVHTPFFDIIKSLITSEKNMDDLYTQLLYKNSDKLDLKTNFSDVKSLIFVILDKKTNKEENGEMLKKYFEKYKEIRDKDSDIRKEDLEELYSIILTSKTKLSSNSIFRELMGISKEINVFFPDSKTFRKEIFWKALMPFPTIENKNDLIAKLKKYKLEYSRSDFQRLTFKHCEFLGIFNTKKGKNKSYDISIKKEYQGFCRKLIESWSDIKELLSVNSACSLDEFLKTIDFVNSDRKDHETLKQCINNYYSVEWIDKMILQLSKEDKSGIINIQKENNLLKDKFIAYPALFEFVIALKLLKLVGYDSLNEKEVRNVFKLKFDSNFIPLTHAPGGDGDIHLKLNDQEILVEVSLTKGSSQIKNEAEPVRRHFIKGNYDACLFIAPKVEEQLKLDLKNGIYIDKELHSTSNIKTLDSKELSKLKSKNDILNLLNNSDVEIFE